MSKLTDTRWQCGEYVRLRTFGADPVWPITRYGSWDVVTAGCAPYLALSALSGSDYSGNLLEHANRQVWREDFAGGEDDWWCTVYGGYGTEAIVVALDKVPEDVEDEVFDVLRRLENYPVMNDDALAHLEMETQDRAWEEDVARDFWRAVCNVHEVPGEPEYDPAKLRDLFEEQRADLNEEWLNEQGTSMYIDVDRIAKGVTEDQATGCLTSVGHLQVVQAKLENAQAAVAKFRVENDALRNMLDEAGVPDLSVRLALARVA